MVKIVQRVKRGCGYRKAGGLYLFFSATNVAYCHRLPVLLPQACPCCGEEIKQIRSVRMINPQKVLGKCPGTLDCEEFCHDDPACGDTDSHVCEKPVCSCDENCPICHPPEKGGLMWVGKEFYSPSSFLLEASQHGISKRIPAKLEDLKPGDWVYFVHNEASEKTGKDKVTRKKPAVFTVARLTEYQKVLTEEEALKPELLKNLEDQGIVPVLERGPMDGQVELAGACSWGEVAEEGA